MPQLNSTIKRRRYILRGLVQGIGMRPTLAKLARQHQLGGTVTNTGNAVVFIIEGPEAQIHACAAQLNEALPVQARIHEIKEYQEDPRGQEHFEIKNSDAGDQRRLQIGPDLATCAECLNDIRDPNNRRYRYPFTTCTHCGPRYTIVTALPYDRPATSMSGFKMCSQCQAEYADPNNRRYHAQTNACPDCGPQLALLPAQATAPADAIATQHQAVQKAAQCIRDGGIVAVHGLGGFQLCCDARNATAVQTLRQRKQRPHKALALMAPDLKWIQSACHCDEAELHALQSSAAPIVLLKPKTTESLAQNVRAGAPELGVMLPYTPLHHCLLDELHFPIVATSANRHGDTLCISVDEALDQLHDIADAYLIHDRPIVRRADDSLLRIIHGHEQLLRRARGFTPLSIALADADPSSLWLASGSQQHNAPAVLISGHIIALAHVGDLHTQRSIETFRDTCQDIWTLHQETAQHIIHDEHPDYAATHYACASALPRSAVQHHLAHMCACLAEHGQHATERRLGIICDGSGLGNDRSIWGGEILLLENNQVKRLAHLLPFRLPGGDAAARAPWRCALALLHAAGIHPDDQRLQTLPIHEFFKQQDCNNIYRMLESGLRSPWCSSLGRLFDGLAALLGLCFVADHQAQAAVALEAAAADFVVHDPYPLLLSADEPSLIDWRPLIHALLDDAHNGVDTQHMAARFHAALPRLWLQLSQHFQCHRLVLSGGCFHNRRLIEDSITLLADADCEVLVPQQLPAGDGGLAVGQLAAACWNISWKDA